MSQGVPITSSEVIKPSVRVALRKRYSEHEKKLILEPSQKFQIYEPIVKFLSYCFKKKNIVFSAVMGV